MMEVSLLLLLLCAGFLLLMLLLHRREKAGVKGKRYARFSLYPRTAALMRRALRTNASTPGVALLRRERQRLALALLRFQQDMRRPPLLPCAADGSIRLMTLAREAYEHDALRPQALRDRIKTCRNQLTFQERLHFPLCLRALLLEELALLLRQMLRESAQLRRGKRLAHRLARRKQPEMWLTRMQPSLPTLSGMLTELRRMEHPALSARVDEWLEAERDCAAADVAHLQHQEQTVAAGRLARIASALHQMDTMDWVALTEDSDPLHRLLSRDPARIYAAMTADSRLMYRQQAARWAQRFRVEETALLRVCLALCAEADEDALEKHVGWYLLEAEGVEALRQGLGTRKGFLSCWTALHPLATRRLLLTALSLAGAYLFLRLGYSLWLTPLFLLLWTGPLRRALPRCRIHRPQMAVERIPESMRTLVVMPAVLGNAHEAIHAVGELLRIRRTLPEGCVDCLLLGDWMQGMTQRAADDADTLAAAQSAIRAVNDASDDGTQYLYLHRARVWRHAQHAFMPRNGRTGAVETVCQLVHRGACHDALDAASFDPALLNRRYTWLLAVDPQMQADPQLLPTLAGVLAHPLNARLQTVQGYRGCSIAAACTIGIPRQHPTLLQRLEARLPWRRSGADFPAACLLQPDALMESCEELFSDDAPGCALLYTQLAGLAATEARAHAPSPASLEGKLLALHRETQTLWRRLPWLLTHVQTAAGFHRNPLSPRQRAELRRAFFASLMAPAQAVLLILAILRGDMVVTALALLLPLLDARQSGLSAAAGWLGLSLLPTEAVFRLDAIWHGLLDLIRPGRQSPLVRGDRQAYVSLWCQALYALVLGISAHLGGWMLPGTVLAMLTALATLLHWRLDQPVQTTAALSDAQEQQLYDMAEASWRWFEVHVTQQSRFLPPDWQQHQPASMTAQTTSARTIGFYLLSCLSARELGLIDTDGLFQRVRDVMDSLDALPRWQGLPFARYRLDSLESVAAEGISARDCGLLCLALLTAAQGLRTHMEEAPAQDEALAARLDAFARSMRLEALYDASAGLFHTGVDPQKAWQDAPHMELFADEGLLLSFAAVMLRQVPAEHLQRLRRTRVQCGRLRPFLSLHGHAEGSLLPALLLPMPPDTLPGRALRAAARLQSAAAHEGLFGMGESGYHAFDQQLRYISGVFGLPELAMEERPMRRVFSPHACALCLPFFPAKALEGLQAMRSLGMLSRTGFLEAVDFQAAQKSTGHALVQLQRADHLAMLLCAICNALTDNALARLLCAMPLASACLVPLYASAEAMTIPAGRAGQVAMLPQEPPFQRKAAVSVSPLDAHVLGDAQASVLVAANGCSAIRLGGSTVTRFSGDASRMEGLQLYLQEGSSLWRLMDPLLPGETVFSEGLAAWKRQAGLIGSTTHLHVDPVSHAVVYSVVLENHDALAHTVTLSSCLIPAVDGQTTRTAERTLCASLGGRRLCCQLYSHAPLMTLSVQTDRRRLLGRNDSLRRPEGLIWYAGDVENASVEVCLSFSARLKLEGHESASFLIAVYLDDQPIRDLVHEDWAGLRSLSQLSARSMADSLPVSQQELATFSRLTGAVLWRQQAHQGAWEPLRTAAQAVELPDVDPALPLITLHAAGADLSLVQQAADFASWLLLCGWPVCLCILCEPTQEAALEDALARSLLREHPDGSALVCAGLSHDETAALDAIARLVIEPPFSLAQLAEMLRQPMPLPDMTPARPARLLPPDHLVLDNGFSGFDPDSGECIVRASSGSGPIQPWTQLLTSSRITSLADERGLQSTRAEALITEEEGVYLVDRDSGACLCAAPWEDAQEPSWQTRFSPGLMVWQTATEELDVTLTAACLSRYACGLRTLRLHHRGKQIKRLMLHMATSFVMGDSAQVFLTQVEGGVTAQSPLMSGFGFMMLTEGDCVVRAMPRQMLRGEAAFPAGLVSEDLQRGSTALLSLAADLPAEGGYTVSWLTGYAMHADELELMLRRIRRSGTSSVFRSVRQQWAARTAALRFETPEKSLDLLLNHWLPNQFLRSHAPLTLLARTLLEPSAVRPRLLLLARDHTCDSLLPLLTAHYVRVTGDEAALNDLVPHDPLLPDDARDTLYARCLTALQEESAATLELLLRMMSIQAFLPFADEPDQTLLYSQLTALQARWNGMTDPHTDTLTAAWSVLAVGVQPRTSALVRQTLEDCYLPLLGVLRSAPGQPQDTLSAAWMVAALARLGWTDHAWELLRALHPMHHTDEPGRMAEYRGAPFAMAQTVYADAPHAGQASAKGSAEAAAVLYTAVVEELLGLERHGMRLLCHPLPPEDWDDFTVMVQAGATSWQLHWRRSAADTAQEPVIQLKDDGRSHQVAIPFRRADAAVWSTAGI